MRRLWDLARSVKLAAVLLAALCATVLISFLVPQRPLFGKVGYAAWASANPLTARVVEVLGLDSVYSSWLFVILIALLAVNLVACTLHRVFRRSRRTLYELRPPSGARTVVTSIPPSEAEAVMAGAGKVRWALRRPESGDGLVLERGRFGWWGSMLLHAGLVLLLLAGIVSALTRFSGTMVIADGQTLPDALDSYSQITESPRMGAAFGRFSISMNSLKVAYLDGMVVDAVALMSSDDGSGPREQAVRVNQPLKVQGKSFLLGKSGHAVAIRVIQPNGDPVAVNINLGEPVKQGYADVLRLPDGDLSLLSVPDYEARAGEAVDKLDLRDPAVLVAAGPQSVWVRPGESVEVGQYLVVVSDVGLWTTLMVRADKGLPIAYVAFALVIIGMCVRWSDPDGMLALKPAEDGTGYLVWYRDRHGSRSAERTADAIVAALENKEEGD